jgi:hypothetical protein
LTPSEFLAALAHRGLRISVKANRLRIEPKAGVSAEDRAYIAQNTSALLAALALEAAHEPASSTEDLLREAVERGKRENARRRRQWFAQLTRGEVRHLVDTGRISPDEVAEWVAARAEREAQLRELEGVAFAAALMRRPARLVDGPDGPVVLVER